MVDKHFDDTKAFRSDVFRVHPVVLLRCGAVVALVRARRRMSMVHHKCHLGAVLFKAQQSRLAWSRDYNPLCMCMCMYMCMWKFQQSPSFSRSPALRRTLSYKRSSKERRQYPWGSVRAVCLYLLLKVPLPSDSARSLWIYDRNWLWCHHVHLASVRGCRSSLCESFLC